MRLVHILPALALALAASPLAQAQDFHVGGQVTLSKPMGDLGGSDYLDGKTGLGFGIHSLIGLNNGHAIVPRFDFITYKRSVHTADGDADFKVNTMMLGVDYNYFVSGKANEGLYLGGGLGYGSTKFEVSSGPVSVSDTPKSIYVAGIVGYMFTPNIGAELRYVSASYEPEALGMKDTVSSPVLNATFVVRF